MNLEISNLNFAYPGKQIFKNFQLQLTPGRPLLIRGSSGSGKSTLLKICAGLLPPDSGEIKWGLNASQSLSSGAVAEIRFQKMLYADQDLHLISNWSILENLQLVLNDSARLDQAIAEFELEALLKQPVCELSGGQRQLVIIARAWAKAPELLLMDEPTAHLDDTKVEKYFSKLLQLYQGSKKSIMITSHDPRVQHLFSEVQVCVGL